MTDRVAFAVALESYFATLRADGYIVNGVSGREAVDFVLSILGDGND